VRISYNGPGVRVGDDRAQIVRGVAKFHFYIGKKNYSIEVLIINNWAHDIILGVGWLKEKGGVLDYDIKNVYCQPGECNIS
jgi:predicted aspartyl protease